MSAQQFRRSPCNHQQCLDTILLWTHPTSHPGGFLLHSSTGTEPAMSSRAVKYAPMLSVQASSSTLRAAWILFTAHPLKCFYFSSFKGTRMREIKMRFAAFHLDLAAQHAWCISPPGTCSPRRKPRPSGTQQPFHIYINSSQNDNGINGQGSQNCFKCTYTVHPQKEESALLFAMLLY